ncbi:cytochrome C [Xanthomonas nasturtii]|uniref:C-type cytochrome n=1 Tax=Xanthomonas nasturtii TaxID=1843581 RepID=A0A3E1KIH3_9XANT|nr:c-type cytochrome [Xanthomonas nasturtii]MCL1500450.1 c-type cytochrome [Xanthomonas nasturtii]MCL1504200.1 c-type cytochrome [Xanthomonas nasturtii]MCL1524045.1 c-type cytochrome [Xanthomonas nasturtii]MCL1525167.1 c-type cytochrome [Xanthomonas nasturtii]MCL1531250.1 c-type cytochrome [Xanthomonas nasturtii]
MNSPYKTVLCLPLACLVLAGTTLPPPARAADGKSVFASECAECHSATAGKNKKGPSLFGIVNRPAGSVADFKGYTADLKASKLTWTTATLQNFLKQDSTVTLPNTKMEYEGLKDSKELDALIVYLNSLH